MNGTFNIKSQTNNSDYEYKNTQVFVNGSFAKDITTGDLKNINGSCYHVDQSGNMGAYIGNFNGTMRDGEVRYSLSDMTRQDSNLVWDAIDDIEPYVLGEDE